MASSLVPDIHASVDEIFRNVEFAKDRRLQSQFYDVTVVAVSTTKPKGLIIAAYNCGVRHFGENYVPELIEKAYNLEILEMCPDIKWHFIGHLHPNKLSKLLSIPKLFMLHRIDSKKVADALELKWPAPGRNEPLNIMIQVNTSGEEGKTGIPPDQTEMLVAHVLDKCPHLNFVGLMTIGSVGHDLSLGPNPDFEKLLDCRKSLYSSKVLAPSETCELSMGVSDDYEQAVEFGSTMVCVGRLIFGADEEKEEE